MMAHGASRALLALLLTFQLLELCQALTWRPQTWQESTETRLKKAKPFYWLHVPKSGSTFLNVLTQHPGICPGANSDDIIVANDFGPVFQYFHEGINLTEACPDGFALEGKLGYHDGLGTAYVDLGLEGSVVTTLREPKSRLISAYNFGMHSWPLRQNTSEHVSLVQYVNMMKGHALKLMVRDYSDAEKEFAKLRFFNTDPTEAEIKEAHRRLWAGFPFVGILEEWQLSVCLFHKMFGGSCTAAEFLHTHEKVEEEKKLVERQQEQLKDFEDPWDGPLYKAALQRFHNDLEKFGVSEGSCQECWKAAGLS